MDIKQSFSLAVKSLMASKLRAILTMLGMIIGVAAVIIIVGLGNGVTSYIENIFSSMGANMIGAITTYRGNNKNIDINQIQELVDNNDAISGFSPYLTSSNLVKNGTESHQTSIIGCNEQYAKLKDRGIVQGRFIQYIDSERIQKVCVLGSYVVDEIFGEDTDYSEIIGQYIKINGEKFNIIGILESKQEGIVGGEDDVVLMPYTVAQRLFKIQNINAYYFMYTNKEDAPKAEDAINKFFYRIYEDEDVYIVINAETILEQMNGILDTLTTFLVAIAGISLLVGGIGIMNIMLVSVTERTKEIGIRKALGARKKDILAQFVIEAITTSAIGGTIGIIVGITLSFAVASLINLTASISILSIIVAFGVSGFIGVAFGYLPANKAAKLHPIDALRYE